MFDSAQNTHASKREENGVNTHWCDCRMNHLVKVDNTADEDKGNVATLKLPEGHVCGEFSFASRAAPSTALSKEEDDGWLVGFCTDETTYKSYFLVCIDSLQEPHVLAFVPALTG